MILFYPWRNEELDLINIDTISLYEEYIQTIISNKAKYVYDTNIENEIEFAMNAIDKANNEEISRIFQDEL